jgi:hypothetical protein
MLLVTAALFGLCSTSVNVLHGLSMKELASASAAPRALGLSYFIMLPFIFGLVPLSSSIYDLYGNYTTVFNMFSLAMLLSAALFVITFLRQRQ